MAIRKHPLRSKQLLQIMICSLISLYGIAASEPIAKPGQWIGNRTLLLADLPLPPKALPLSNCLTLEDTKKQPELLSPLKANAATMECQVGERTITGGSLTAPLSCKSLSKIGRLEITMTPTDVQGKVILYKGETEQAGVWMTITDTYNWSSETCTTSR